MAERFDDRAEDWPLRPWLMAAICAVGGLLFHLLADQRLGESSVPASRQAAASFVVIGTLSFVLTVERLRWTWALAFAVAWAIVIALVGWFTASYNSDREIFEWPFFSGLFAVLLAAPLFQTARDQGRWDFPYSRLHSHAWTDAVIGIASLFFTGVAFLLAWLIAGLFKVIGIEALENLLEEEWFAWMLAGFAFGAAVGLLRERDRLVATLQRLVMVVFAVLAPVLAIALAAFLLSIPFTGLGKLWDSWLSAAALLLTASAGAILLANAVIGDGREQRSPNRLLRGSAMLLVAVIAPLAVLAGLAMGVRIGEYGWTPERIWGAVAVAIALAYGIGGWWALWRGRWDFDDRLRPLQTRLALFLCGLALFLALPIVDFGAISARSQVARLEKSIVTPAKFDWAAMAFDFGPAGRKRLAEIARSGPPAWRSLASSALKSNARWDLAEETRVLSEAEDFAGRIRLLSNDIELTPDIRRRIAVRRWCSRGAECALLRIDEQRLLLLATSGEQRHLASTLIDLRDPMPGRAELERPNPPPPPLSGVDLGSANVEVRTVVRRQVHVNGKPVGEPFE